MRQHRRRPSHCSVLIKQSVPLVRFQFLIDTCCTMPVIFLELACASAVRSPTGRPPARHPRALRRGGRRSRFRRPGARVRVSSISAYLESQSFFRSYGSILPTSLVCIVRYRPEATRLGDLLRSIGTRPHEIQLHLLGFSRDDPDAPDDAHEGRRFSAAPPTASPLDALPRSTYFWRPYQEKSSSRAPEPSSPGVFARYQAPAAAAEQRPEANLRVEARESMPDSLSVGQGRVAQAESFVPAMS